LLIVLWEYHKNEWRIFTAILVDCLEWEKRWTSFCLEYPCKSSYTILLSIPPSPGFTI